MTALEAVGRWVNVNQLTTIYAFLFFLKDRLMCMVVSGDLVKIQEISERFLVNVAKDVNFSDKAMREILITLFEYE